MTAYIKQCVKMSGCHWIIIRDDYDNEVARFPDNDLGRRAFSMFKDGVTSDKTHPVLYDRDKEQYLVGDFYQVFA